METLKRLFLSRTLLTLTVSYLIFRLLFLTTLPIFNDESIYLDWGYKEITLSGRLFYSLIDGKQPFLMWIFGIFELLISNPLIAGRIVAVLCGLLTMLGLYFLGKRYFSKEVAILGSLLYLLIPIFSSYDRLALMESAISAAGVWSLYLLLRSLDTFQRKYAVLLGVVLGLGFFTKSNAAIFLVLTVLLFVYAFLRNSKRRKEIGILFLVSISCFVVTDLLLFLQPLYWQTLAMNSRYSLTPQELLGFPVSSISSNLWNNAQILFFFVTPVVLLFTLIGEYLLLRQKRKGRIIALWLLLSFCLQTLLVRATTQRYLVSVLPLVSLVSFYSLIQLKTKYSNYFSLLLVVFFLIPGILTVYQMINPVGYVKLTEPLTQTTESGFIYGQTSGYGIAKVVELITNASKTQQIFVATAINIGNPESAMQIYFHGNPNVKVGFLDSRMFGPQLDQFQCIQSVIPIVFVSRDQQQANMNAYFEEVYRVKHPYSDYSLGLYQLKSHCTGKTVQINPLQGQT